MQRKTVLLSLFLLATMVLASIPASGLRSNLLTEQQNDDAEAATPGGPFGIWERVFDKTTFYFDTTDPSDGSAGFYDYELPGSTSTTITIDNTDDRHPDGDPTPNVASFDLPLELLPPKDMRIYGISVVMYAACNSGGTSTGDTNTVPLGIDIEILDRQEDGTWQERDTSGSDGHQPYVNTRMQGTFLSALGGTGTYSRTIGTPGLENGLFMAGNETRLRFQFDLANPAESCELYVDGDESSSGGIQASRVTLLTDSPRLNGWLQDPNGDPTVSFPSGATAGAQNRIMNLAVMQASNWQQSATYTNENDPKNHLAGNYDGQYEVRLRDLQTSDVVYREQIRDLDTVDAQTANEFIRPVDQTYTAIGDELSLNELRFQYSADLPDSRYRWEIFGEGFSISLAPISVGLKSFEIEVIDGTTHEVNPEQPTLFNIAISNTGGEQDAYTTTVLDVPSDWYADMVLRSSPPVAPGSTVEQQLYVEPPTGAQVGDEAEVTVRTVSSFGGEVDPVTTTVTVTVVDDDTAQARLTGAPSQVEIAPGETIEIPSIRLHNDAPFADNYLLRADFPDDAVGWSAKLDPVGGQVLADSVSDFALTVRAPLSVQDGAQVSLTVEAVRVGTTGAGAEVVIPLQVEVVRDLEVSGVSALSFNDDTGGYEQPIRNNGAQQDYFACVGVCVIPDRPITDNVHENTATFRVEITNPTPLEDTIDVVGSWRRSGSVGPATITDGTASSNSCSDPERASGWPDYWRVDFRDDIDGSPGARVDTAPNSKDHGEVTIPPYTTVYHYLELGWVPRGDTSGCPGISNAAAYKLTFQSQSDRAVTDAIEFGAYRVGAGSVQIDGREFSGSMHQVHIEPERTEGERFIETEQSTVRVDGSYDAIEYPFRVVNLGNEHQDLIVEITSGTTSGWTQSIESISTVPDGNGDCSPIGSSTTRFECPLVGAGDEALLKLVVQPGDNVPLHRSMETSVQVRDEDSSAIRESLEFTTSTIGEFDFDAAILQGARSAEAGATVSLPFVVQNTGSEGDDFETILLDGDPGWRPRFSGETRFFLPGQSDQTGFLLVTIPENAATGIEKTFRVQIENGQDTGVKVLDFEVKVVADTGIDVTAVNSDGQAVGSVLLPERGLPNEITLRAVADADSAGVGVTFAIDDDALPPGWSIASGDVLQTATLEEEGSGSQAEVTVEITPPTRALSSNRVPLIVAVETDETDPRVAHGDIVMTLTEEVGVSVDVVSESPQRILAGGAVSHFVQVSNLGLGADTFTLTNTALPTGWNIVYGSTASESGAEVALGPLENETLEIVILAPENAPAKQDVPVNIFATSSADTTVFDQATITTVVGFNDLTAEPVESLLHLAPEELGTFIINVHNNGTLPDVVDANVTLETTALADVGTFQVATERFELRLNQTTQLQVRYTVGSDVPSEVAVVLNLTLTSLLNTQAEPVQVHVPLSVGILPYAARDIDGDSIREFAVDRDRDADNGFEEYRESTQAGGRNAQLAPLEDLLSEEAHASYNVTITLENGTTETVFQYVIDGDEDGKVDHFLDRSGDGMPDIYWDPDGNHSQIITVFKDTNGDSVPDLFVDINGDGRLDRVFDVRTGKFTPLLVRDINGDGKPDYVVDKNGNGVLDDDETILYVDSGVLVTVLKVDVDGDGKLDDVFDIDGDNRYDYFIRAGETTGRDITYKDVNGDGIEDWTYDANGDGTDDHYYNPATQEGGLEIDSVQSFASAAAKYWFVPALFLLVLVLFVVLIAVTRR